MGEEMRRGVAQEPLGGGLRKILRNLIPLTARQEAQQLVYFGLTDWIALAPDHASRRTQSGAGPTEDVGVQKYGADTDVLLVYQPINFILPANQNLHSGLQARRAMCRGAAGPATCYLAPAADYILLPGFC